MASADSKTHLPVTGPVTESDVSAERQSPDVPSSGGIDLISSHVADVAGLSVRRALPRRSRRTVGAWCFLDHMGPVEVGHDQAVSIGPHPHMGLQTVTWLIAGEILHRDSLGSEQLIRPGQLNLMTAGAGVSHAEATTGSYRGEVQGVQLWLAQPESTRHGSPAFEHHGVLPRHELAHGAATVLVGTFGDVASPARRDTDHVGVDLDLDVGVNLLPLAPDFEYGLVVLEGAVRIGPVGVEPGHLAYLGVGRHELGLAVASPTRAILIGGLPFPEPLLMWWNFVGRTREEIATAWRQWQAGDDRFGVVDSPLPRIPGSPPAWLTTPSPPSRRRE
jgi:redox-sensitive bicupin YhaK (pirin superfamily)